MNYISLKKVKIFGVHQTIKYPEKVALFFQKTFLENKNPPKTPKELSQLKNIFSAQEKIPSIENRDLIAFARGKKLEVPEILQKRAVRTISGVSPIGILTKPFPCPGKCIYCPTDARMPKSYLASQPAAARALRNKFHPFAQVSNRITALEESGHPVSKLEIIVMGGTWSFLPAKYQNWFVREIFRAANFSGSADLSSNFDKKFLEKSLNSDRKDLKNLQKQNETANRRIIGLTLETRPDFITEKELKRMREFGCTRIEIGVQTLDDDIQKLTKRGHFKKDVARAMKLMKNYGFKVCFHLMPGLPGSTPEKDLVWLREVFENPDFCPDFVKIYPCQVLPNSELAEIWKSGKFQPYDDETLIRLLVQFQSFVPEWTRIMRLMRDIPVKNILAGAKFSNLRQIIQNQPEKLREIVGEKFYHENILAHENLNSGSNLHFRDIRAREIGLSNSGTDFRESRLQEPILVRRDYSASDGLETFLSFESADKKHLFALLRLRKPTENFEPQFFKSVLKNAALIREVHSYGGEISVGDEKSGVGQHRGLGKKLLAEAERIARDEWHFKKITIIAGIGTREYYRKFGYELKDTYMTKKLVICGGRGLRFGVKF